MTMVATEEASFLHIVGLASREDGKRHLKIWLVQYEINWPQL